MKIYFSLLLAATAFLVSCQSTPQTNATENIAENPGPVFQNQGHELVYEMVQKTGNYEALAAKKDVVYTYTYETPDGKKDVSTEKYIFDGELSLGVYHTHERTMADLEGPVEQGYDGREFWLKHNGQYIDDEELIKQVHFKRKTNFYWFAMFQKLLDPGLKYEYLKEEAVGDEVHKIVKITFESENGEPTDIYQLYINQATKLVDQFLFTVVEYNVVENPMLMQVEYEEVDGILIPSKRKYKKSTWNAEVSEEPWILVSWTDIKFDNGLERSEFGR